MKNTHPTVCRLYLFAFLWLCLTNICQAQQAAIFSPKNGEKSAEFFGKLDSEATPDTSKLYGILFEQVKNVASYKFVNPPEKEASVTVGELYDGRVSGTKYEILIVEPKNGRPYLYSDVNGDGKIEESERLELNSAGREGVYRQTLRLPVKNSFYRSFPIYLQFEPKFTNPNLKAGQRVLFQTIGAFAGGEVKIDDRFVRVQYPFDPAKFVISTTEGLFGIDVDGDGKIKNAPFSPETSYATNDEIVFKLGSRYLSTFLIDLTKNQIVMRTRQSTEYRRVDLEVGKEMPDFSFVDFKDQPRFLKEFRGKYLLVDFWGMWCVDCRREIPFQIEAVKRFGNRQFEILGMDSDEADKFEEVKAFLIKNKMDWTQAKLSSIKSLIETAYRIQEYPSTILLGPDGKVLVLDQKQLAGEKLYETLDRILPKQK
ncbi:MAG: TlpA disulfide reductase family protein [Actinomycetota bacterium]